MIIGKCTDVFQGKLFRAGGQGERDTWEDLSMEEFIIREVNFHEGVTGFLRIIKKNNEKTTKKVFSTGSKEQHQN